MIIVVYYLTLGIHGDNFLTIANARYILVIKSGGHFNSPLLKNKHMKKLVTYSKIGYNAPSQANWSYGIWKVDCIDTNSAYCMSYTVYENFGGDSRFRAMLETHGIKAIETRGVQPTQKVTGIKHMENMESNDFINKIVDFINPNL